MESIEKVKLGITELEIDSMGVLRFLKLLLKNSLGSEVEMFQSRDPVIR